MRRVIPLFVIAGILAIALLVAQTAPPMSLNLTATTANVAGAPDSVRIEILRWSTDEERGKLMSAWELKTPRPAAPEAGQARGETGKRWRKRQRSRRCRRACRSPDAARCAQQSSRRVGHRRLSLVSGKRGIRVSLCGQD